MTNTDAADDRAYYVPIVERLLRKHFKAHLSEQIERVVKERTPELRIEAEEALRRDFEDEVEKRLKRVVNDLRKETRRRLTVEFERHLPEETREVVEDWIKADRKRRKSSPRQDS